MKLVDQNKKFRKTYTLYSQIYCYSASIFIEPY